MSQSELLKFVKELLESLGIEYMLTGSMVSSALGEPELTLGIEVLVAVDQANVERLTAGFNTDEFYWSAVAARSAVAGRRMFNVLRTSTGQKIDFYVLPDDAFEQARFARRKPLEVDGVEIMAATAEDIILGKLNWTRQLGHSERQFQDALRVYEVNAASLDREYMAAWVQRLGLQAHWSCLLESAEPFNAS